MPKNWRMIGSEKNGSTTRRWVVEEMFTTAGDTFDSIGASDGSGWPLTAGGSVPALPQPARANNASSAAMERVRRKRAMEGMRVPFRVLDRHGTAPHPSGFGANPKLYTRPGMKCWLAALHGSPGSVRSSSARNHNILCPSPSGFTKAWVAVQQGGMGRRRRIAAFPGAQAACFPG